MANKKTQRTNLRRKKKTEALGDGPPTKLVTTKELSRYLNVSRSTIQRMVKSGQIPYTELRGVYRFDVLAVRAVLDRNS